MNVLQLNLRRISKPISSVTIWILQNLYNAGAKLYGRVSIPKILQRSANLKFIHSVDNFYGRVFLLIFSYLFKAVSMT